MSRNGAANEDTARALGQLDEMKYGDLLKDYGPSGKMSDEYLANVSGSTVEEIRRSNHNARNDSGVRPMKGYINND